MGNPAVKRKRGVNRGPIFAALVRKKIVCVHLQGPQSETPPWEIN